MEETTTITSALGYETSDKIDKLAAALCKTQSAMEPAIKDSKNPFFKSNYADLASVWRACRKELTDNGISILQLPTGNPPAVSLTTIVVHSSGQFIASSFAMEGKKQDPQSIGSMITYMRRYALSAAVGISTDDDDANAASSKGYQQPINKQPTSNTQVYQQAPKPVDPDKMVAAFAAIEISKADLEAFISKPMSEAQPHDYVALKKYYKDAKG